MLNRVYKVERTYLVRISVHIARENEGRSTRLHGHGYHVLGSFRAEISQVRTIHPRSCQYARRGQLVNDRGGVHES